MPIDDNFSAWYVQESAKADTNYPPPYDTLEQWQDGQEIHGFFVIDNSGAANIAGGKGIQTTGKFCVNNGEIESQLKDGYVLRNELGSYIKLIGVASESSDMASVKIRLFGAEMIEPPSGGE